MRLKLLTLVILWTGFSSFPSAQQTPSVRTFGELNGHWWTKCLPQEKSVYFLGLLDGWKERESTESEFSGATLLAMDTGGITLDSAVALIDHGYTDPANIDLPVGWVYMAEVAVKRGDTSADSAFTSLRHLLNSILTAKKDAVINFNPVDALRAARKP